MKLYAPLYYSSFSCIADRCRHTCCVGWEIDVDEDTLEKYESLTCGYGEQIKDTVDLADMPHFRLAAGDRCPHLDSRGLCRIITEMGEDYLCSICREHPRFYHDTPYGREVGIGMACEEACRLILTSDGYQTFAEIGEVEDGETTADACAFDAVTHRSEVYELLADREVPYGKRLEAISGLYGVSPSALTDAQWVEEFSSLEYLEAAHRALFSAYTSDPYTPPRAEKSLERALAYMIFRHCSDSEDREAFCASLGFCLVVERLLASLMQKSGVDSVESMVEVARIVSEEIEYSEENTETLKSVFAFL